ncbi:MAG TPA: hypothetical protein VLE74_02425 [Candidatus Saccharimonadales bacterium]|nr:hypothetical protein [Candidatus Saccharimonadales bacterium]
MEELPEVQFNRSPEVPASPEPLPDKAAEWLLGHQHNPETTAPPLPPETPMSYELDITPETHATVSLEQMTEADFDRHEVLAEQQPDDHPKNGMVPVSQILASRSSAYAPDSNSVLTPSRVGLTVNAARRFLARPLYRQALVIGARLGLLIGIVGIVVYIIIK